MNDQLNPNLMLTPPAAPLVPEPPRRWWRTKQFRIGLGIFAAIAVLVAVLFGDQISRLLDLFGTRAGQERVISVDGTADPNSPNYLGNGTFQNTVFNNSPSGPNGTSGAVILTPPQ